MICNSKHMVTVGVDLAYRDPETALCAVDWGTGKHPDVIALAKDVSDDNIMS